MRLCLPLGDFDSGYPGERNADDGIDSNGPPRSYFASDEPRHVANASRSLITPSHWCKLRGHDFGRRRDRPRCLDRPILDRTWFAVETSLRESITPPAIKIFH